MWQLQETFKRRESPCLGRRQVRVTLAALALAAGLVAGWGAVKAEAAEVSGGLSLDERFN